MFEPFSSGYYLGRLYVTPHDEERAAIHSDRHEQVNAELYADGDGIDRLDYPLVMKLESAHFPVHGDRAVPDGALALPPDHLERSGVDNPPALREVFLAKADRAAQLLALDLVPA